MKKYLLCAIPAALLLQTGVSAAAANPAATPAPSHLLQSIPEELRLKAKSGAVLTLSRDITNSSFTLDWGENDGSLYILGLTFPGQDAAKYGVFDFAANQWRIPCTYDGVYFIPNHRYFLVTQGAEKSICYEAEADGKVNPEPLPINGKVCGVDRQGYVTLYRAFEVDVERYPGDWTKIDRSLLALLDNHYQTVLDYVVGVDGKSPKGIHFDGGVAMIRTGGTSYDVGKLESYWKDSTVGFINRKGEWVGRHDYIEAYHYLNDCNARFWTRSSDEKYYWAIEDGGEKQAGQLNFDPDATWRQPSDWAKATVAQAESRGLVPEKLQGFYTLDAYREELCALLVNLYEKSGKALPDTPAPTFTDCEYEHVGTAAVLGLVTANDAGEVRPRARVTRQEAADMLYRFVALFQKQNTVSAFRYPDDAAINAQYKPQVYAMRNLGIINATASGTFAPNDYFPMEQAVTAVNRLYDLLIAK